MSDNILEPFLENPSAGQILKTEFIDEISISQDEFAKILGVSVGCINQIVQGKRSITADIDLRMCKFFDLTDGYFLRLQSAYEVMEARRKIASEIEIIPCYYSANQSWNK